MSFNNISAGTLGILLIVLAILTIIFFPLAVIWAGNTLFSLGLQYTFWNWLAVIVLGVFIRGYKRQNKE